MFVNCEPAFQVTIWMIGQMNGYLPYPYDW